MLKTGLSAETLGLKMGVSQILECDYKSVSGDPYRTVSRIQNLKLLTFETEKVSEKG